MVDKIKQHKVQWTPEKIEAFWEAYVADYALTAGFFPADFYEVVFRKSRRYLNPNIRCLDIGCGTGTLAQLLSRKGYQVTGVDISSRAIEHTRRIFEQNGFTARFFACPLDRTPFEAESFDVVFATEVLEHLEYDYTISVLKEVRRILSPQGVVVITTPHQEKLSTIVCPDCLAVFHPMGHFQSFDETKATKVLQEAGFDVLNLSTFPTLFVNPDDNLTKAVMKRVIRGIFKRLLIKLRVHNLFWVGRKTKNKDKMK